MIALRMETLLVLIIAWGLVFVLPLRHTRRLFGLLNEPTDKGAIMPSDRVLVMAQAIAARVERGARRLPWNSTCLVRAIAARLLLDVRGITGAKIRFGVRKTQGVLEAHAWLILGGGILLGGQGAENFVPLADLGDGPRHGGQGPA